jgi:hypothetical protein
MKKPGTTRTSAYHHVITAIFTSFMVFLLSLSIPSWAQDYLREDAQATKKPTVSAMNQRILPRILEETASYCEKLEEASIYYFCKEKIKENIYLIPKKYRGAKTSRIDIHGQFSKFRNKSSIVNEFLYEYQVIRKGKKEKERRILLKENGKDKYKKNAGLKTYCFKYTAIVLYPLVFKKSEQQYYRFKILAKEKWTDRDVYVIQVLPRPGIQKNLLWGKFWVDEKKFSILKIEIAPTSIGNYYKIKNRAAALNSKPRITIIIDYTIEKNSIRFPGQFLIEEAYITPEGTKILLAEIMVHYQEYRFFSVGVDVKYRRS